MTVGGRLFAGITVVGRLWAVVMDCAGGTPALRVVAGGLAEAAVEELAGGGHAVVGPERSQLSLHDVDEEAGYGASGVGVLSDYPGELGVERGWASRLSSIAVGGGVRRVVSDEVGGVLVAVGGKEPGGLEAVADAEVVVAVLHDVDEEVDDGATAVGPELDYL